MGAIIKKLKSFMKFFIRPGARVVFIYRLSHWCYEHKLIPLFWILDNFNHFLSGCEISGKAVIGKNFLIPHAVGIVIGSGVVIGDNVTVFQNVSLASKRPDIDGNDYPTIGNNVDIFTNAMIAGKIKIGNDAVIGAHALVTKDVPDGATAFGTRAFVKTESSS